MTENINKPKLVIPGDLIATGYYKKGVGVFDRKDKENNQNNYYYAGIVGLVSIRGNVVSVIPLEGTYRPLENDIIIGKVENIGMSTWKINLGGPYSGVLSVNNFFDRDSKHFDTMRGGSISRFLSVGDLILAKIIAFDRTRDPMLTMQGRGLRKLSNGRLIVINSKKVPRVIGKAASMISMIKRETNSSILVGRNGRVLIQAPNFKMENLIIRVLEKIQEESHISGLTDRIKLMIQNELSNNNTTLAEEK